VLGLAMPLTDPSRAQVDNALLSLGVIGILLVLLLPPSGMVSRGPATRVALAVYGALSLISVLIADFGTRQQLGWTIKIPAVVLAGVAMGRLLRFR
jgi:hypothetical protein